MTAADRKIIDAALAVYRMELAREASDPTSTTASRAWASARHDEVVELINAR